MGEKTAEALNAEQMHGQINACQNLRVLCKHKCTERVTQHMDLGSADRTRAMQNCVCARGVQNTDQITPARDDNKTVIINSHVFAPPTAEKNAMWRGEVLQFIARLYPQVQYLLVLTVLPLLRCRRAVPCAAVIHGSLAEELLQQRRHARALFFTNTQSGIPVSLSARASARVCRAPCWSHVTSTAAELRQKPWGALC